MDKNGYNKSILRTEQGECYLCGRHTDTARHEVYFGSNRGISKQYGLWVNLCPSCHQHGKYAVHRCRETDLKLKKECQQEFEKTHSRDEFIKAIGKSYD